MRTVLKLLAGVLVNADLLGPLLLAALAVAAARRKRLLRPRTVLLCLLPLGLIQGLPVGRWLLMVLEERFPRPAELPGGLPADLAGLVILGGSFNQPESVRRGDTVHNFAGPRLFEALAVARRHPAARIVFTGTAVEAAHARRIFAQHGVDPARAAFDDAAVDTRTNALNAYALARPEAGESWALATSAAHLPRAVGLFRGAGWGEIIPYPVQFVTSGRLSAADLIGAPHGAFGLQWRAAAHELLGCFYHHLAGDSPELFPAPRSR